jgi:16S rRNA (guanine1516-N2)-methyltransferase
VVPGADDDGLRRRARALSQHLSLPFSSAFNAAPGLRLVVAADHLELCDERSKPGNGVTAAFPAEAMGSIGRLRREPLGRAFGRSVESIVDATAGLGRDAFFLAIMGYRVLAIERSPVIFALLADGVRRARECGFRDALSSLEIRQGDACEILPALKPRPDAVYLDPMFPPKRKASALPKKEMQVLRRIVGRDVDADELFEVGRRVALDRVVVKRADDAPHLRGQRPDFSQRGKLVRYDVYLSGRGCPVHGPFKSASE